MRRLFKKVFGFFFSQFFGLVKKNEYLFGFDLKKTFSIKLIWIMLLTPLFVL